MAEFTLAEVARHKTPEDLMMVIRDKVYRIPKKFAIEDHPGGDVLMEGAGIDATSLFEDIGHSEEALAQLKGFCVGKLKK